MSKKIMVGVLTLLMVPFIQGCDERDVATGVVVGAVVGGAIVAVSTDDYDHDDYYRSRYNDYYQHRRVRYNKRYGNRYGRNNGHHRGPRLGNRDRGNRGNRGRGNRRWPNGQFDMIQATPAAFTFSSASAVKTTNKAVLKFADFYQMPTESAEIIWNAKQKALKGNLQGLVDLGLYSKDFQNLVNMKKASNDTVYRMSLRTGLDEDHLHDILVDFQQEIYASKKAGRIAL